MDKQELIQQAAKELDRIQERLYGKYDHIDQTRQKLLICLEKIYPGIKEKKEGHQLYTYFMNGYLVCSLHIHPAGVQVLVFHLKQNPPIHTTFDYGLGSRVDWEAISVNLVLSVQGIKKHTSHV